MNPPSLNNDNLIDKSLQILSDTVKGNAGIAQFQVREGQLQMAAAVARSVTTRDNLLVEAGTGTGKSLAYLVPVLLSSQRTVISTGTRRLQDQLLRKDFETAVKLSGQQKKIALLKGRRNYLCPYRLHKHISILQQSSDHALLDQLIRVRQWSQSSRTGDLAEMGEMLHGTWAFTSGPESCLGRKCPDYQRCPLYRARDQARQADIVIVNHHLLLSDLSVKEEGYEGVLPDFRQIVIDEAHQWPDVLRTYAGEQFSQGQLTSLLRDLTMEHRALGDDDPTLKGLGQTTTELMQRFSQRVETLLSDSAMLLESVSEDLTARELLDGLEYELKRLRNWLDRISLRSAGMQRCYERCRILTDRLEFLIDSAVSPDEWVTLVQRVEQNFVITRIPVDVSTYTASLYEGKNWILTSATLSLSDGLGHFQRQTGTQAFASVCIPSPFRYQQSVCGYIPRTRETPGSDEATRELVVQLLPLFCANQKKSLMLFTSHRALNLAATMLSELLPLPVLTQNRDPDHSLLERFRDYPRALLLATQGFWQGVDLQDYQLKLLVIDKLPFAPPDDPLVAAALLAKERAGQSGFDDYLLPMAASRLLQGFGRLIRHENDRGVFVLGDSRVRTMPYGQYFLNSLPPLNWIEDQQELEAMMEMISK
ncbi:MAG: ATP-dependent DNA helicase [Pseudomonadales bacterium]|nr:ATP-dependent DNA helicase [Pseudomonadales bacterium]